MGYALGSSLQVQRLSRYLSYKMRLEVGCFVFVCLLAFRILFFLMGKRESRKEHPPKHQIIKLAVEELNCQPIGDWLLE